MKIYDISTVIEPDMVVYNDAEEKKPVFNNTHNHENSVAYETVVTMDIHCGTHIDMPLHMIKGGKTMDAFDISRVITNCKVFDLSHLDDRVITAKDIKHLPIEKDDFILFKTKNSFYDESKGFDFEFVYVDESAALVLKKMQINGAGIDALGIERAQKNFMTHKLLLEDDVIILEGLRLKDVPEGEYKLIALPIKIKGTEGSWVRAVLIEE